MVDEEGQRLRRRDVGARQAHKRANRHAQGIQERNPQRRSSSQAANDDGPTGIKFATGPAHPGIHDTRDSRHGHLHKGQPQQPASRRSYDLQVATTSARWHKSGSPSLSRCDADHAAAYLESSTHPATGRSMNASARVEAALLVAVSEPRRRAHGRRRAACRADRSRTATSLGQRWQAHLLPRGKVQATTSASAFASSI
jgi:hypothetical protein